MQLASSTKALGSPSKSDQPSKSPTGHEFSFSLTPEPDEGHIEIFVRLATALQQSETVPIHIMIFGDLRAQPIVMEAMRRMFGPINWPVTWVEGFSGNRHAIAGMQVFAFSSNHVTPIRLRGEVAGCAFTENGMRHCVLGGLGPNHGDASPSDQLRQTLENLEVALDQAGFSLCDVVRTWYYLDDLLSWYPEFNRVRSEIYSKAAFRAGSLPASTGISASNPAGAALVTAAWAMQPTHPSTQIMEIPSPLQCPAPAYGSSFSRAIEISSLQGRRLLISGTASIAPEGQTLRAGDIRGQIELTMEVVKAILESRSLALTDVTRATAYFKQAKDMTALAAWCAERGLPSMPVIATQCGICRDDLLFELEADAWKPSLEVNSGRGMPWWRLSGSRMRR